jgi:outer membrane protein assembly factor BamB
VVRTSWAGFFLLVPFLMGGNWPQWRGPHHNGVSDETGLPETWSETTNIIWKLPMPGMGCSTPAIWGDRIFLTSENGPDIVLLCISTDGEKLWQKKIGSATRKARGDEGNGATASPSTDGQYVFAFAGSGELCCFTVNGQPVWQFNVQQRYGRFNIQFGMHSTPTLHGDRLYMQTLHTDGQWVFAVDKRTGEEIWKIDRPADTPRHWESPHGYASTTLWQKGGEAVLIVHGNDYTTGHRLEDGAEIWRVGSLNKDGITHWRFVASPAAAEDLIVIPTCKNGPTVAIRPDVKGHIKEGSEGELWRYRATPDVPTPLIHNGLVYLCRAEGQVVCLDAKTGKVHYEDRGYNSRHRASPVLADGKIYLTARNGTFSVIAVGPEFRLISRHKLDDEFAASPAISNGRIYLRGFKSLYAVGRK